MADINQFIPFILKWEGGYSNDPADLGGPTNKGITLKTWQDYGYDKNGDGIIDEEDLKLLLRQDLVECVLRPHYWNRWQADRMRNQSLANIVVDWLWMSGITGIKTPQQILDLTPDGIVGEKTLAAINDYPDQRELFERFKTERVAYIETICNRRPVNNRFKKGWLNRLNDLKFSLAVLAVFLISCLASCKSVTSAENTRMETRSAVHSERESEEMMKTQWNRIFSRQAESEANIETVTETFTVRFDTSSPDSTLQSLNPFPIKEISKTTVSRGKVVRTSISEEAGSVRTDSVNIHSEEKIDQMNTENLHQQTLAVSNTHRWWFILLAAVVVFAGIALLGKRIMNY